MKVHLFRSGKGMITGGHTRLCYTVPNVKGTLIIGDRRIDIDGSTEISEPIGSGMKTARFICDDGVEYAIGTVSIKCGSVISLNAESEAVIDMLHAQDELFRKYEELSEKYSELKAMLEYDSIGFITGDNKNEA